MSPLTEMIRNRFLRGHRRALSTRGRRSVRARRVLATETLEPREMLDGDPVVDFRLAVTDLGGSSVSSVEVGESFLLSAYVEDLREIPIGMSAGVFSAYLDVVYDAALASLSMRETQLISLTGDGAIDGSFMLTYDGQETEPIAVNSTGAEIETKLAALSNLASEDIEVQGEEFGPWIVRFGGSLAGQNIPELTADSSSVIGDNAGVSVVQISGIDPYNTFDMIGSVSYGPDFTNRLRATTLTDGLLDEIGAARMSFSSTSPLGLQERLLFTVQMTADAEGELGFQSSFATGLGNEISLYGLSEVLTEDMLDFGSTTLTIEAPTQEFGQLDVTIVTTPTATDSLGQVANLPNSAEWIHEWQDHWVEVWAELPSSSPGGLGSFDVDLSYETAYFTATQIEAGPALSGGLTSDVNDSLGNVNIAGTVTAAQDVGLGQPVLLARVLLESLSGDAGVPVDISAPEAISSVGEPWVELVDDGGAQLELGDASHVIPVIGASPTTDLYPVLYDLDNNGLIGFGDLSIFSGVFLKDVNAQAPAAAHKADFDLSNRVDFGDFSLLSANFLRSRAAGNPVIMPAGFPAGFDSSGVGAASSSAPPSTAAHLMAAPESRSESSKSGAVSDSIYAAAGYDSNLFSRSLGANGSGLRSEGMSDREFVSELLAPVETEATGAEYGALTKRDESRSDSGEAGKHDHALTDRGVGEFANESAADSAASALSSFDEFYAQLGQ